MAVVAPVSGRLSDRYGSRGLSTAGLLIVVAGFLLLARVTTASQSNLPLIGTFVLHRPRARALPVAEQQLHLRLRAAAAVRHRLRLHRDDPQRRRLAGNRRLGSDNDVEAHAAMASPATWRRRSSIRRSYGQGDARLPRRPAHRDLCCGRGAGHRHRILGAARAAAAAAARRRRRRLVGADPPEGNARKDEMSADQSIGVIFGAGILGRADGLADGPGRRRAHRAAADDRLRPRHPRRRRREHRLDNRHLQRRRCRLRPRPPDEHSHRHAAGAGDDARRAERRLSDDLPSERRPLRPVRAGPAGFGHADGATPGRRAAARRRQRPAGGRRCDCRQLPGPRHRRGGRLPGARRARGLLDDVLRGRLLRAARHRRRRAEGAGDGHARCACR